MKSQPSIISTATVNIYFDASKAGAKEISIYILPRVQEGGYIGESCNNISPVHF